MRDQIIKLMHSALKDCHSFFVREEDIQLYLANYFIRTKCFDSVFIEYHLPKTMLIEYPWSDINNLYIDIVLVKNGKFYPIEIKYKTKEQLLPFNVFGENVNVVLGQHGAQNIGCYDFWKDVKRIEIFEETFEKVEKGLVLFVSNDESYQKAPLNSGVGYAHFSIHSNRKILAGSILEWNKELSISKGRPSIALNNSYFLEWHNIGIPMHSYLLL